MTIEEAIEKSQEGGYKNDIDWDFPIEKIFLDPQFWQALGKAMGLEKCKRIGGCLKVFYGNGSSCLCDNTTYENVWLPMWHKFIDHLAEGKTAEDYFKQL